MNQYQVFKDKWSHHLTIPLHHKPPDFISYSLLYDSIQQLDSKENLGFTSLTLVSVDNWSSLTLVPIDNRRQHSLSGLRRQLESVIKSP